VRRPCRRLHRAADRAVVLLPEEFSEATADARGRHVIHDETARRLEDEGSAIDDAASREGSPSREERTDGVRV
jgi:hypothetical protein